MQFLFAWLRQQLHCLVHFHRPMRLDGLYTGPEVDGPVSVTTLGCSCCGKVFIDNPYMPYDGPMPLSKPWFEKLKPVDD